MERYLVTIDDTIATERQLFARFTETIFLGESGIENWDWFEDLLWTRLHSEILVELVNSDLSNLSAENRRIYLGLLRDMQGEFPGKLVIKGQSLFDRRSARMRWLISEWYSEVRGRYSRLRHRFRDAG